MITSLDANNIYANYNAQAEQALLKTGYDKMSTEDKNSLIVIIADKENMAFTDITAEYILNYHKKVKIAYLEQQRDTSIHTGFTSTDTHTYSISPDDQTNMLGQMLKIMRDPSITSVQWVQEETQTLATYTVADWTANVFDQAFSFKDNALVKCKNLGSQVLAATTHDAIVAIAWS